MPPYALPDGGVVSGIKSDTHKGSGYNEISMTDEAGKEKITIHAQKDPNATILNDETTSIGNNQTITVQKGDRKVTVEKGTNTETVKGNSSHTVQAGSCTVTVAGGDLSATSTDKGIKLTGVGTGVEITGCGKGTTIAGSGGSGVKISGAPSAPVAGKADAKLSAPQVEVSGGSKVSISAPTVDIGNANVKIHGFSIELSAGDGSSSRRRSRSMEFP
jgi:type VI secretion system secreted protein VgrG